MFCCDDAAQHNVGAGKKGQRNKEISFFQWKTRMAKTKTQKSTIKKNLFNMLSLDSAIARKKTHTLV